MIAKEGNACIAKDRGRLLLKRLSSKASSVVPGSGAMERGSKGGTGMDAVRALGDGKGIVRMHLISHGTCHVTACRTRGLTLTSFGQQSVTYFNQNSEMPGSPMSTFSLLEWIQEIYDFSIIGWDRDCTRF